MNTYEVDVLVFHRAPGGRMYGPPTEARRVEVLADDETAAQLIAVQLVASTLADTAAVVGARVVSGP